MADTLFPTRQRCIKCRKAFGAHVLSGKFCSYKCAGHPEPTKNIADAPRECAYPRGEELVWKRRYRIPAEVPDTVANRPDATVYHCSNCLYWHSGTAVARTVKESKEVRTFAELADTLVKARGKNTRTTVAKAAGIRPIRLKEIEEGAASIDPAALFAVLGLYRISISMGFRETGSRR